MSSLYESAVKALGTAKRRMALKETPPKNRDDAANMLHVMGELRRSVNLIEAELERQIAELRQKAEQEAQPYAEKYRGLEDAMLMWAEVTRDELTQNGKRKTVELGSGSVIWRTLPPSVKLRKTDDVLAAIEQLSMSDDEFSSFLRVKQEVNKEAMLANPDKARMIPGVTIGSAGEKVEIVPLVEELAAAKSIN